MIQLWTRRRLLGATALTGAAALVAARPAQALRAEENPVAERLYLSACESRAAHDELVQELIAQIEGQEGREKAVAAVRDMRCPTCGCSLALFTEPLPDAR